MEDLAWMDAMAQAALVRRGDVQASELVEAAIARIERLNPALNAVIHPLFESARRQAAGPLPVGPFSGVPFLVKDLFCATAGDPYHAGMRLLKDRRWTATRESYLAARFRAAGLVILGRTNVPELGPVPTTEPAAYGPSRNPWDTGRMPGGSSGGSAVAVAAGMVPLAHGNDGGGSIRIPASCCGLFGLKPSRGRTSLGPEFGSAWDGAVAEHVLTRSVRDSAAILDAVAGYMPGDPYVAPAARGPYLDEVVANPGKLRIGLLTRSPGRLVDVHPDCVSAAREAARLLEFLGHRVEEAHPEALDEVEFQEHLLTLIASWTRRDLDYWSAQTGHTLRVGDVEPYTWGIASMGESVSAAQYIASTVWLQEFTRRLSVWWTDGFDLLLTPTVAEPPARLGDLTGSVADPMRPLARSVPFALFTAFFNISGQPAMSVPLYWNTDGLPIGVQLVAAYGREDLLVRLAGQLERAQPWADRRPSVCA